MYSGGAYEKGELGFELEHGVREQGHLVPTVAVLERSCALSYYTVVDIAIPGSIQFRFVDCM